MRLACARRGYGVISPKPTAVRLTDFGDIIKKEVKFGVIVLITKKSMKFAVITKKKQ